MTARTRLVDTLLRSDEPSIRWKVRANVLGESPSSKRMRALSEEVRASPRVHALLAQSGALGREGTLRRVYYKWQGLHWVLAHLADLGYPRGDKRLLPIRDRVYAVWLGESYYHEFDAKSASASYARRGVPRINGKYRRCGSQQGNALYSTLALGIADERVGALVERLLHWQWPDGGWNCARDPKAHVSSFMETRLPMMGLALYARERRDAKARRAAERAAEVFLIRSLFKRATTGKVIKDEFVTLHYPLYWHYDVLGGLTAMRVVGALRDRRCADALDLLESKELRGGGWAAERKYYAVSARALKSNHDWVDWGGTSRTRMNEWVTVDALAVLAASGRARV